MACKKHKYEERSIRSIIYFQYHVIRKALPWNSTQGEACKFKE